MKKVIRPSYRLEYWAENCSYSMWKLIRFSANSVAVRRSPIVTSRALISWVYRTQVSGDGIHPDEKPRNDAERLRLSYTRH
jgi:hypothetical protein